MVKSKDRSSKKTKSYSKRRNMVKYFKNTKNPYRKDAVKLLQNPDMKPPVQLTRFIGRNRYVLEQDPTAQSNLKSVICIPANHIGEPVETYGTWTMEQKTGPRFTNCTDNNYALYDKYVVLGSHVEVRIWNPNKTTVSPYTGFQSSCIAGILRTFDTTSINSTILVTDMEKKYGLTTSQFGSPTSANYKAAYLKCGYKPGKTYGIKDATDCEELQCETIYNTVATPLKKCFYTLLIGGMLDSFPAPHHEVVVEVQVSYIVKFTEPTPDNCGVTS